MVRWTYHQTAVNYMEGMLEKGDDTPQRSTISSVGEKQDRLQAIDNTLGGLKAGIRASLDYYTGVLLFLLISGVRCADGGVLFFLASTEVL